MKPIFSPVSVVSCIVASGQFVSVSGVPAPPYLASSFHNSRVAVRSEPRVRPSAA